ALARGLAREATFQMAAVGNVSVEALVRSRVARLSEQLGSADEAKEQLQAAAKLFAKLTPSRTVELYKADGEIEQARVETMEGHAAAALTRLRTVAGSLAGFENRPEAMRFFRAQAGASAKAGDNAGRESALRALVTIAEAGLSTIATEQDRLIWA